MKSFSRWGRLYWLCRDVEEKHKAYIIMCEKNKKLCISDFAHLLLEWDQERNVGLDPQTVRAGSNKKFGWTCIICKHKWAAKAGDRTRGNGCPECAKHIRVSTRRASFGFQTKKNKICISDISHLLAEYDYEANDNIKPENVCAGSGKKIGWVCVSCGHRWLAKPRDRKHGRGCPKCGNKKLGDAVRAAAAIRNPLSNFPDVYKQFHPFLNGDRTPDSVSSSCNDDIWWLGDCGHTWLATPNNRTCNNSRCPYCLNDSVGELRIAELLNQKNIKFIRQYRDPSCRNKNPLPFDFAILKENIVVAMIEYHGIQHYEPVERFTEEGETPEEALVKRQQRDNIKKQWCKENNIHFLEISYDNFNNIEELLENYWRIYYD